MVDSALEARDHMHIKKKHQNDCLHELFSYAK